jgi:prepilin peptidase CpaA
MRIPNWLTIPSLVAVIAARAYAGAWPEMLGALAGTGLAFGLLFVPFALRWLGAGDVKAVMVLGALWGGGLLLPVLWWMLVAGGLLAAVMVAAGGGLPDLVRRWTMTAFTSLAMRRWSYFGPAPGTAAARGLPFAVAMGLGACAYQLWGSPWT